jgi:hypothetical protein
MLSLLGSQSSGGFKGKVWDDSIVNAPNIYNLSPVSWQGTLTAMYTDNGYYYPFASQSTMGNGWIYAYMDLTRFSIAGGAVVTFNYTVRYASNSYPTYFIYTDGTYTLWSIPTGAANYGLSGRRGSYSFMVPAGKQLRGITAGSYQDIGYDATNEVDIYSDSVWYTEIGTITVS